MHIKIYEYPYEYINKPILQILRFVCEHKLFCYNKYGREKVDSVKYDRKYCD